MAKKGRSEIVSNLEKLRNLVIQKHGGRMRIAKVLVSNGFREGYSESSIRTLTYQVRKRNKGFDNGFGTECWEILDSEIIALERLLTRNDRLRLQKRRQAKIAGVATQTILDNRMFSGSIAKDGIQHKEEIKDVVDQSTTSLEGTIGSSVTVRKVLIEYSPEFETNKELP